MNTKALGTSDMAFTHQSPNVLIPDGEDFLCCLRHTSLPHLRLLVIQCHHLPPHGDERDQSHVFNTLFNRVSTEPLLVVLEGEYYAFFFTQIVSCLPPNTHLLLDFENGESIARGSVTFPSNNVEAVYCGQAAVDLSWLSAEAPARKTSPRPMKIFLPTGFRGWVEGHACREELRGCGFEVEVLPNEAIVRMLRSLLPMFSQYSTGWWKHELLQDPSRG
jgi:hypothetical protein